MLQRLGIEYSAQSMLTDAEMQEAYATSDFLLFASTLEGFGMPILEAQIVGVPVITGDLAPMNEVAGDGALLCDPLNPHEIRACIQRLKNDVNLYNEITERGILNGSRFSPASSANMLQTLYARHEKC
jgi:glycosyltransferase involved in cell wall biosynthesis